MFRVSLLTRRRLLATAAISGGVSALLTEAGGQEYDPSEAAGWRHPQATPGNTATSGESGPQVAEEVDWQQTIADSETFQFRGFAKYNDTLLVPTHERLLGVSTTGEHQFEVDLDSSSQFGFGATQLDTSPHVAGQQCFITSGIAVFALDATSGRRRWRYDLNSSIDALVLLGNTLYLSATTDSGPALVALDTTSGRKRWHHPNRLVPLAADADHLIGAETESGRLRGIDPATGELLWRSDRRVEAPTLTHGSVAIADGTLWHLQAGRLTALDAASAAHRWTVSVEGTGSTWGDRFAVADKIYVLEPDSERLTAVGMDGEPRWSRELRDASTGIAVGTETVYASTRRGLEAVAVSDGERRFRVAPAERPGHALTPLVSDGAVYGVAGGTLFGVSDA